MLEAKRAQNPVRDGGVCRVRTYVTPSYVKLSKKIREIRRPFENARNFTLWLRKNFAEGDGRDWVEVPPSFNLCRLISPQTRRRALRKPRPSRRPVAQETSRHMIDFRGHT